MDSQLFADVGRNPLLRPDKIDEVLTYFRRAPNIYEFAELMPLVAYQTDRVQMDYSVARAGGMTPMVATGSASPIHGGFGRGAGEFEAIEFREKILLLEQDLVDLRRLGSKTELKRAQTILSEKFAVIEQRLLNRLEWMRRQVLFDQAVVVEQASGVPYTVQYNHPAYLDITLTGADQWSDYANSDPLVNMQEWFEDYTTDTGFDLDYIQLPKFMWKHLQKNDRLRGALLYNRPTANVGVDQITSEIVTHVGLGSATQIRTSRGQIAVDTQLTAVSAQSDTTLDLASVAGLSAGDTIYVASAAKKGHYKEKFTVASISGNVVTVSGGGVAHADGFAAGDPVRFLLYTQPTDKVLFVGSMGGPEETVGVEGPPTPKANWGEMATTLSRYSSLMSPTTGVFTKTINKENGDPPRIEQVLGIKALPKLNSADGWMTIKVL
jgi:hypothetical protein